MRVKTDDNKTSTDAQLLEISGSSTQTEVANGHVKVTVAGGGAAQATITPNGNDQTAEIQAALNGVDAGAAVGFATGSQPFIVTNELTVDQSVTLAGQAMNPYYGAANQLPNDDPQVMPCVAPLLQGSVLNMRAGGKNFFNIRGRGLGFNVRNIGLIFGQPGDSIMFQNTGHGFYGNQLTLSGHKDQGIMGSYWENVAVYGTDGNHYAYNLTNCELSTFNHLQCFGGGGWSLESDFSGAQGGFGNIVITHPYIVQCAPGTAHAVSYSNNGQITNMIKWIRPQVWHWTAQGTVAGFTNSLLTPIYANQYMWLDGGPAARNSISDADMETLGNSKISSVSVWDHIQYYSGDGTSSPGVTFLNPAGLYGMRGEFWVPASIPGIGSARPKVLYIAGGLGTSGFASAATAAAGANAGTSPPAPVISGTILSGRVTWGSGSTPAAGDQVAVTYGASGDPLNVPRVILNPNNDATYNLGLRATTQLGTGFKITTHGAPAGSQANTVYSADWIAIS